MIHIFYFLYLSLLDLHAWGPKGQEITVKIAESYFSPKASKRILEITSNRKISEFSTWADQARNSPEWRETGIWHYINVADNGEYQHDSSASPADVQDAIAYSCERLQSNLPDEQKLAWLKFLVHFVGDLHQPMHIGREADRGGNSTYVMYPKKMNLHYLWDTALLDSRKLSVDKFVSLLSSQNRSNAALNQKFDSDVVIKENFDLRQFTYSFKNGAISSSYEKQAMDVIDDRLWVGGLRLAQIINSLNL